MFNKMLNESGIVAAFLTLFIVPADAASHEISQWPDAFTTRIEILALVQTLNANLLASRSATITLEKWCTDHKMAPEPKVIARRLHNVEKLPSAETREHLRVGAEEKVQYRHVELFCGDHVLSEADNWYVPSRLSDEMNHALDTTETSFGRVVQSLRPFRQTIGVKILWSPLPQLWELEMRRPEMEKQAASGFIAIPHEILEHRAILYNSDHIPFSEVDEKYTNEVLNFELPANVAR